VSRSRFCRRALVALLLAAACVPVGGPLTGVAAATSPSRPAAGSADPAKPPAAASKPASTATVAVRLYTVRRGDCLVAIAARHHYPGGWPRLYAHNRRTLGPDPDLIHPGQTLRLVLSRPDRRPSPAPRRPAIAKPKAPASPAASPVEAVTAPRPTAAPAPELPTEPRLQASPTLIRAAFLILLPTCLVLAALTSERPRGRRRTLPVAHTPPVADPTPTPPPHPAPTSITPTRSGPTAAKGDDPVSFSLVVLADGDREANLTASLSQLAALEDRRLGIVVVVGEDDPPARSAAEAMRRRLPDRLTVVTDRRRPGSVAATIDRALPACHGEVTGVLAAGAVHPELLDRVADHVRHDGATMVWAGPQSPSCSWSSSRAPGRHRLRLATGRGQLVFVRTELLRAQPAKTPSPPPAPPRAEADLRLTPRPQGAAGLPVLSPDG
jgi:Glycosyltransferase like family 2/LysM domain